MTASATESAMLGLVAALNASTALPPVRRDPVFDDVMDYLGGAEFDPIGRVLAVRAGDAIETVRRLGTGPDAFELWRNADIEWLVSGDEGADLNTAFDEGISAIIAAIVADPTLGGAVSSAEVAEQPDLATDQAGARAVLTALIRVQLTYTSPRAY